MKKVIIFSAIILLSTKAIGQANWAAELASKMGSGIVNALTVTTKYSDQINLIRDNLDRLDEMQCEIDEIKALEGSLDIDFDETCSGIPLGVEVFARQNLRIYSSLVANMAVATGNIASAATNIVTGMSEPSQNQSDIIVSVEAIDELVKDLSVYRGQLEFLQKKEDQAESSYNANLISSIMATGDAYDIGDLDLDDEALMEFVSFQSPDYIKQIIKNEKTTVLKKIVKQKHKIMALIIFIGLAGMLYTMQKDGGTFKMQYFYSIMFVLILFSYINIIWK